MDVYKRMICYFFQARQLRRKGRESNDRALIKRAVVLECYGHNLARALGITFKPKSIV
jgi:hypothetical protein